MTNLFIFGLGYSASYIASSMRNAGWQVIGTGEKGEIDFADKDAVIAALDSASHILSSVPPIEERDIVLDHYGDALSDKNLSYISSTGVYGDTKGAWVDESAALIGLGPAGRRSARANGDARWMDLGARVFRLPGIYGPGRNIFERLTTGKARRIDLPNQVFSRIHVEDIASGVCAALVQNAPTGAYNLADDMPASQNAVIEEACRLSGQLLPPMRNVQEAGLSEAALGFYSENRRVANGKAKRILGWRPQYPSFREGLAGLRPG